MWWIEINVDQIRGQRLEESRLCGRQRLGEDQGYWRWRLREWRLEDED